MCGMLLWSPNYWNTIILISLNYIHRVSEFFETEILLRNFTIYLSGNFLPGSIIEYQPRNINSADWDGGMVGSLHFQITKRERQRLTGWTMDQRRLNWTKNQLYIRNKRAIYWVIFSVLLPRWGAGGLVSQIWDDKRWQMMLQLSPPVPGRLSQPS